MEEGMLVSINKEDNPNFPRRAKEKSTHFRFRMASAIPTLIMPGGSKVRGKLKFERTQDLV